MLPTPAVTQAPDAGQRVIIALDVDTAREAREIVDELKTSAGAFKIGLRLFTSAGPEFVSSLTESGVKVFLDLKFYDIPNTVAGASIAAARLRVWMFNMHASGGREMMTRASAAVRETCEREHLPRPLMVGVTVLTSSNAETLAEVGCVGDVETRVKSLATLANDCGLDGVVASPNEVAAIRSVVKRDEFLCVTPGIRTNTATGDDQKRVTTLGRALAGGSDYVVIGRPILQAADRVAAMRDLIAEMHTSE